MFSWISDAFEVAQLFLLLSLGAVILFALHRFLGWRGLVAGATALLAMFIYRKGRGDGRTAIIEKEAEHAEQVVRQADDARIDARHRDADPRQLRVDDGFKRPS